MSPPGGTNRAEANENCPKRTINRMSEKTITFQPEGRKVHVPEGSRLGDAVTQAGIPLEFSCGGKGTCGKCRVQVLVNLTEPNSADKAALNADELGDGIRLACQTVITESMTVEVPKTSRLADTGQILSASGGDSDGRADDPPVVKQYIELPTPTLEDDSPDLERISRHMGDVTVDASMLRELPVLLRECGFAGTAVLLDGTLIGFEPGDTTMANYAVAFDIGTTTLVGVLVSLHNGHELASTSRMNPQTRYGDDVLARIQLVRENEQGLQNLNEGLIDAINGMIDELIEQAHVDRANVYEATFAGNTTMLHLVAGVSPAALGEIPFVPVMRRSLMLPAEALNVAIHPRGRAVLFPVIGGFVGGDTVAGILVSGIADSSDPTMLLDIGTNGELVIRHEGRLLATSCAAGPAFEGATVSSGMRATVGAIEEVELNGGVHIKVIGGVRPTGLCGSALIDLTAELLRHGILTSEGLMLVGDDLPSALPAGIRERVRMGDDDSEFIVATAQESASGRPIVVTGRDFRDLQVATAAIRAGVSILLKQSGLEPNDLAQFLVAGAFGNYIRGHNGQRMGLLPHGIDPDKIRFIGNASLWGARRVAFSKAARFRADQLARSTLHVELSRDPNFQMEYVEAMFFPREETLTSDGIG